MHRVVSYLLPLILGLTVGRAHGVEMERRRLSYPCALDDGLGAEGVTRPLPETQLQQPGASKRAAGPLLLLRFLPRQRMERRRLLRGLVAVPRDPQPLWSCPSQRVWVDLGDQAFPRLVAELRCLNATCWRGHYACQPLTQIRQVLVRQNGSCLERRLPSDLNRKFMFAEMKYTAACRCASQE